MSDKPVEFRWKDRLKSFGYAFNGLKVLFRDEHNARIHLAVSVLVLISGFFFDISATEWLIVIVLIGLVFAMEIINSAIENICDLVSPQKNEYVKKAKDLGAAAVMLCALVSVICGFIIFVPKICSLLSLCFR